MALFFLFVSFFFAIWGGIEFFSVYFSDAKAGDVMVAGMTGIALAVIPYMIGKSLADMIAIRQRHLILEQGNLQQEMMIEGMGAAALELEAATQAIQEEQTPSAPPSE